MFSNNIFKIETPRLILRCYQLSDAEDLREAVISNKDHLLPWMPWADLEPQSLEEKVKLLRGFIASFYQNKDFIYGIWLKSGKFIGGTGLHTWRGPKILETGYWIIEEATNQGYASEATYAMMKVGFCHIGVEKIEIRNHIANEISGKIPEKFGFTKDATVTMIAKNPDGSRQQHHIWNMFKVDFRAMDQGEPILAFDALGHEVELSVE